MPSKQITAASPTQASTSSTTAACSSQGGTDLASLQQRRLSQAQAGQGNLAAIALAGLQGCSPDPETAALEQAYGAEAVGIYLSQFADYCGASDKTLVRIVGLALEAKDTVGNAMLLHESADAILGITPATSPGEGLRQFKSFFDLARILVPYCPMLSEFLAMYSVALESIAESLEELAGGIRGKDQRQAVTVHEGAWSGGHALANYLRKVPPEGRPVPVPEDLVAWVMDNRDLLTFVTGEAPPAERRTTLGLDMLATDDVDATKLADWFVRHRDTIANAIYGDVANVVLDRNE